MTNFSAEEMFKAGLDNKSALSRANLLKLLDEQFGVPPARGEVMIAAITKELENASITALKRLEKTSIHPEDLAIAGSLYAIWLAQLGRELRDTAAPVLAMMRALHNLGGNNG